MFSWCRLAAQLARTEEAAKRLMVRSDRSARGGAAARLLAAEKELCRITADATETHSTPLPNLLSWAQLRLKQARRAQSFFSV